VGRQQTYNVKPIGVVRSPYASRKDAPKQGPEAGGESVIELDPKWSGALEGIEPGRDLWVLTYFHAAEQPRLKIHPRGDPSRPLTGLFNTRAPSRPNPIGLTLVRLVALEGNRLTVRGLEALDNTPVLDIKPYVPGVDQPKEMPAP
jgi:tRNA-Thr(GGU) m(6)t(6)A37 methyltransferase TsaA